MTIVDWVGVVAVVIPAIFTGYKMFSMLKDMQRTLNRVEMDTLRLKFLTMVQQSPTEVAVILSLFDEYKRRGGDSWIDDIFLKWKKEYGALTKRK